MAPRAGALFHLAWNLVGPCPPARFRFNNCSHSGCSSVTPPSLATTLDLAVSHTLPLQPSGSHSVTHPSLAATLDVAVSHILPLQGRHRSGCSVHHFGLWG